LKEVGHSIVAVDAVGTMLEKPTTKPFLKSEEV
jgi:hypothetical protein